MKHLIKFYVADKLLNFFIRLNNYSYSKISSLVVIANNGLHPKHEIMKYYNFFVNHISPEDTVLDIGCGNGYLASQMAQKATDVYGIDFNEKNIAFGRSHYQKTNLHFLIGDALTYQYSQTFDIAVLSNVLEHIEQRVQFLARLRKVAPRLLIRVPLLTRGWLPVYLKGCGFEYRLDRTHCIEYHEKEITDELAQAGWTVQEHTVQWGEWYGVCQKI